MGDNIVILGATSAIAQEVARHYAKQGAHFFLISRNESKLQALKADLQLRGAGRCETHSLDLLQAQEIAASVAAATRFFSRLDLLLVASGSLPVQQDCEKSPDQIRPEFQINCVGLLEAISRFAGIFERQKQGAIAVLSSVAGDRGRKSNYIYGAAKAALSTFLEGLRFRLRQSRVNVLTVKPGPVLTPMTQHLKPGLLWARPQSVALSIVRAIESQKPVLYTPGYWYWIMLAIRLLPGRILGRLSI